MARLTLDQVLSRYREGRVSQVRYEAFDWLHAALSPYRYAERPTDPAVLAFAALLCAERGLKMP